MRRGTHAARRLAARPRASACARWARDHDRPTRTSPRDIDACCRLTGEFTLRSGQVAPEYFDKYLFEADPALLARVAAQMVDAAARRTPSCSAASSSAASRSRPCVSARTGLPALFVRKQAKEYGTCKLAEGPDVAGRRVTLVEDVITTGGAVRDATRALRDGRRGRRGRGLRDRPQPRRARTRWPTSASRCARC